MERGHVEVLSFQEVVVIKVRYGLSLLTTLILASHPSAQQLGTVRDDMELDTWKFATGPGRSDATLSAGAAYPAGTTDGPRRPGISMVPWAA